MNSPPDPGSPISTESSGSPPAEMEESNFPSSSGPTGYLANLTSQISTAFGVGGSGSSKRRLPSGPGFSGASARDAKSRKRGDTSRSGTTQWEGSKEAIGGKKEKDELIDNALVEQLRKDIGDPFLEPDFKN
ncbi:hypothetical protein JR316_0003968 [Psilocybe cubensis]|uniref:Uncharacterized protein n=2 Tax=Psilocybe cubensis TaxID=181762 RepID=A0A8H7Y666_PSICU|nr:hypothetical protein JR316_0003968 [Psilocybe cubensis]KAH9484486.1 hypothetical protein JR316_0003968 [Psilocybe cubensis]